MPGHDDRDTTRHHPNRRSDDAHILRDNRLSLVMFGLFGLCLLGHSLAGYAAYRDDQQAHQQPPIRYTAYVTSSHWWASVFENWESEFLQMAAYVLATVFCFQRGSAESKDPDSRDKVDEDRASINTRRRPPGRCGRGDSRSRSMPIPSPRRSPYCSLLSFLAWASGTHQYNAEQRVHGQAPLPCSSTWAPRAFGLSHSKIGRANF